MNGQISAYQIDDGAWIGVYVWRGETYETDETHATRAEAETDAAEMLAYLEKEKRHA